jgi:ABC-type multidrug transport system ATPase subunit
MKTCTNLTPYIAYIPQEDAFDPLLKVQENLDFSVAVRCPHLKTDERRKRVEAKLAELGLADHARAPRRHAAAEVPQRWRAQAAQCRSRHDRHLRRVSVR